MNRLLLTTCAVLLSASTALFAQNFSSSAAAIDDNSEGTSAPAVQPGTLAPSNPMEGGAFSRIAFSAGFSPMGISLSAATNLNRYMNVRGTGNIFKYSATNISTNGFNVDAKLNFASAGASLDFYPFPNHGFRVSPGVLFFNQNGADATFNVTGGTSFTLNDTTYYASSTDPVMGTGKLGLHSQKPAFTATTGWGNMVQRGNGHWSFPVEVGAAFIGSPALNIALTQGKVCNAQGIYCVDVATDPNVQADLQEQVAKYKSDLDPLKTYPIVSFGVAYSFHGRSIR